MYIHVDKHRFIDFKHICIHHFGLVYHTWHMISKLFRTAGTLANMRAVSFQCRIYPHVFQVQSDSTLDEAVQEMYPPLEFDAKHL